MRRAAQAAGLLGEAGTKPLAGNMARFEDEYGYLSLEW